MATLANYDAQSQWRSVAEKVFREFRYWQQLDSADCNGFEAPPCLLLSVTATTASASASAEASSIRAVVRSVTAVVVEGLTHADQGAPEGVGDGVGAVRPASGGARDECGGTVERVRGHMSRRGSVREASPSGAGGLPSSATHQTQGDKAASKFVDLGGMLDSLDDLPHRLAPRAGDDDGELHRVFGALLTDDA